MSLHADLLRQARSLARNEPRRPRQASLRRAISTAYYALFHLLIDEATRFLVQGPARRTLRVALARAFEHGEMKAAAVSFGSNAPPAPLVTAAGPVPLELSRLALTFVELQQARHEADYDRARSLTRREAVDAIEKAEQAFADWERVRGTPAADAFLVALLVRKRLGQR